MAAQPSSTAVAPLPKPTPSTPIQVPDIPGVPAQYQALAKRIILGAIGPGIPISEHLLNVTVQRPEVQGMIQKAIAGGAELAGQVPAIVAADVVAAPVAGAAGALGTGRLLTAAIRAGTALGTTGILPRSGEEYTPKNVALNVAKETGAGSLFGAAGALPEVLAYRVATKALNLDQLAALGVKPETIDKVTKLAASYLSNKPAVVAGASGLSALVGGGLAASQGGTPEDVIISAGLAGVLPLVRLLKTMPEEYWQDQKNAVKRQMTQDIVEAARKGDLGELKSLADRPDVQAAAREAEGVVAPTPPQPGQAIPIITPPVPLEPSPVVPRATLTPPASRATLAPAPVGEPPAPVPATSIPRATLEPRSTLVEPVARVEDAQVRTAEAVAGKAEAERRKAEAEAKVAEIAAGEALTRTPTAEVTTAPTGQPEPTGTLQSRPTLAAPEVKPAYRDIPSQFQEGSPGRRWRERMTVTEPQIESAQRTAEVYDTPTYIGGETGTRMRSGTPPGVTTRKPSYLLATVFPDGRVELEENAFRSSPQSEPVTPAPTGDLQPRSTLVEPTVSPPVSEPPPVVEAVPTPTSSTSGQAVARPAPKPPETPAGPRYIVTNAGMMKGAFRVLDTQTKESVQTGRSKKVLQGVADEYNAGRVPTLSGQAQPPVAKESFKDVFERETGRPSPTTSRQAVDDPDFMRLKRAYDAGTLREEMRPKAVEGELQSKATRRVFYDSIFKPEAEGLYADHLAAAQKAADDANVTVHLGPPKHKTAVGMVSAEQNAIELFPKNIDRDASKIADRTGIPKAEVLAEYYKQVIAHEQEHITQNVEGRLSDKRVRKGHIIEIEARAKGSASAVEKTLLSRRESEPSTPAIARSEPAAGTQIKSGPAKLQITKKGNAVGFDKDGNTITVGYMPKSKSWQVALSQSETGRLIPESNVRFGTKEEATAHATGLIDRAQTERLAWWDTAGMWSKSSSSPATKPAATVAPKPEGGQAATAGKQPWEMTLDDFRRQETVRVSREYPDATPEEVRDTVEGNAETDWMKSLREAAKSNRIPDAVLDDAVEKYGVNFLRNFRGDTAKGIEGYVAKDARESTPFIGEDTSPKKRLASEIPTDTKVRKGIYYFPSHDEATKWAQANGWPTDRIIAYKTGYSVQSGESGTYAGPATPRKAAEPAAGKNELVMPMVPPKTADHKTLENVFREALRKAEEIESTFTFPTERRPFEMDTINNARGAAKDLGSLDDNVLRQGIFNLRAAIQAGRTAQLRFASPLGEAAPPAPEPPAARPEAASAVEEAKAYQRTTPRKGTPERDVLDAEPVEPSGRATRQWPPQIPESVNKAEQPLIDKRSNLEQKRYQLMDKQDALNKQIKDERNAYIKDNLKREGIKPQYAGAKKNKTTVKNIYADADKLVAKMVAEKERLELEQIQIQKDREVLRKEIESLYIPHMGLEVGQVYVDKATGRAVRIADLSLGEPKVIDGDIDLKNAFTTSESIGQRGPRGITTDNLMRNYIPLETDIDFRKVADQHLAEYKAFGGPGASDFGPRILKALRGGEDIQKVIEDLYAPEKKRRAETVAAIEKDKPVAPATPPKEADFILRPPMPDAELAGVNDMKGKKIKFKRETADGETETIEGLSFGDFAIASKATGSGPEAKPQKDNSIYHVKSGLKIGYAYGADNALTKKRLIYRLQNAGLDWDFETNDTMPKETAEKAKEIVDSFHDTGEAASGAEGDIVFNPTIYEAGGKENGKEVGKIINQYKYLYDRMAAIAEADPDFARDPVMTVRSVTEPDEQDRNVKPSFDLEWRNNKPTEGGERLYRIRVSGELTGAMPEVGQTVRISKYFLEKAGISPAQLRETDTGYTRTGAKGQLKKLTGADRRNVMGFPAPTDEPPDPVLSSAAGSHRMPMRLERPSGEGPKETNAPAVIEALVNVVEEAGKNVPIRTGGFGGGALGIFKVRPEVIRLRTANDIPVAWHETAHALEKAVFGYPKGGPWKNPAIDAKMQGELTKLGRDLYGNRKPSGGYKREGFAEFLRLWGTNPTEATTKAPIFSKWFESEFLGKSQKVRDALESARDKTARWQEMGSYERAKASIIDPASLRSRAIALWKKVTSKDAWMTQMVDAAHPLDVLAGEVEKRLGRELGIAENPYEVMSATRKTAPRIVRYMVEKGMTDLAGNVVGKPLSDAAKLTDGRQQDFTIYLWAKRSLALWNDPRKPRGRNPGLSKVDATQIIRELDSPQFQQAAQIVYDWSDGVLNYAAQASPTFAEVVKKIRAVDPGYYVPLRREFEELTQDYARSGINPKGGSLGARLKGSGRRIIDPMQSLISKADGIVRAAQKRRVLDTILKLAEVEGMGHIIEEVPKSKVPVDVPLQEVIQKAKSALEAMGVNFEDLDTDTSDMVTFFAPARAPKGGKPIVPIVQKGKVKWFYVDPHLYNTLSGIDIYRLPALAEWLVGKPTAMLRAGATGLRATFNLITNPLKDPQTLVLNSQAKANAFKMFGTWINTMRQSTMDVAGIKQDPFFGAFVRLGGEMALPLGPDTAQTRRATRQLFEGRAVKTLDPRNWLDFYRDLIQFPEAASRVTEFKQIAKDIGWDPSQPISEEQALTMLLASKRATTDFTAAGRMAEIINRIVPFFNAAIQGPRVTMRRFQENPSRVALRGLAIFTIPTLMLWWTQKDKEWWKNLPYREKFLNWHIPVGENDVVRIPRAFEPGMMFAALPEALLDAAYQHDPEGVKEWGNAFFDTANPVDLPPVLGVPYDIARNEKRFFGTPVVSKHLERRSPEEQYDEYTSRVAVFLGKKLGWSPQKVDYAIQGFTGGLGTDITTSFGTGEGKKDFELSDIPIAGKLFLRGGAYPGGGAPVIRKLYEAFGKAELRQASVETPETDQEKTHRQILSDATKAVSFLMDTRKQTANQKERRLIAHEVIQIAQEALRTSNSPSSSRIFLETSKNAEMENYLKGLETGKTKITNLKDNREALSKLVLLRARDSGDWGPDAIRLVRKMQPEAKTGTQAYDAVLNRYGMTKKDFGKAVADAENAEETRWAAEAPEFESLLSQMEARLSEADPKYLRHGNTNQAIKWVQEDEKLFQAILDRPEPKGRTISATDLLKIALRRARAKIGLEPVYREAAD